MNESLCDILKELTKCETSMCMMTIHDTISYNSDVTDIMVERQRFIARERHCHSKKNVANAQRR